MPEWNPYVIERRKRWWREHWQLVVMIVIAGIVGYVR